MNKRVLVLASGRPSSVFINSQVDSRIITSVRRRQIV